MNILRTLPLVVVAAACSGASGPPPPVATASPGSAARASGSAAEPADSNAVQPLSSRDNGGAATPGAMAGGPEATLPPGHPPITGDPHGNTPAAGDTRSAAGEIRGTIQLSPKLSSGPSDVLYVMAKKGQTTLAARRVEKPRFPYAFELSAADSMMAGAGFSGPVDVVARLSRTGDAIPSPGDLEGTARGVAIPSRGVKLTIDGVRQ